MTKLFVSFLIIDQFTGLRSEDCIIRQNGSKICLEMFEERECLNRFDGHIDISADSTDSSTLFVRLITNSPDSFVHLEGCGIKYWDTDTETFLPQRSFAFLKDGCLLEGDNFIDIHFGNPYRLHRAYPTLDTNNILFSDGGGSRDKKIRHFRHRFVAFAGNALRHRLFRHLVSDGFQQRFTLRQRALQQCAGGIVSKPLRLAEGQRDFTRNK